MKRIWLIILAVVLVLSIALSFLLPIGDGDSQFWWSRIRGFFALFGFVICVATVSIAKLIGHYWLQRREDYYD